MRPLGGGNAGLHVSIGEKEDCASVQVVWKQNIQSVFFDLEIETTTGECYFGNTAQPKNNETTASQINKSWQEKERESFFFFFNF